MEVGGPTTSAGHHSSLTLHADERRLRPVPFFAGASEPASNDAAEATNARSTAESCPETASEPAADSAAEADARATAESRPETASDPATTSAAATKGAGATAEPCWRASGDISSTIEPARRISQLD